MGMFSLVSGQPALPELLAECAAAECELAEFAAADCELAESARAESARVESARTESAPAEAARAFTAASKNFFTPSHDSWSARALSFGFPPLVLILPDTGWA
jgi:hypothetical protein